jgi:transcription initiation factor TFIIIB Brf1 subunit/transcription initiation factor TFIIB
VYIEHSFIRYLEKQLNVSFKDEFLNLLKQYEFKLQGYSKQEIFITLTYIILKQKLQLPIREFLSYARIWGLNIDMSRLYEVMKRINNILKVKHLLIDIDYLVERYGKNLGMTESEIKEAQKIANILNDKGGKHPIPVALASLIIVAEKNGRKMNRRQLAYNFGTTDVTVCNYIRKWKYTNL